MGKLFNKYFISLYLLGLILLTACSYQTNSSLNEKNNAQNNQEQSEVDRDVEVSGEVGKAKVQVASNENAEIFEKIVVSVSENEKVVGTFEIDLMSPEEEYELDQGVKVVLLQYFPDYILVDGEPHSQSNLPANPAFIFDIVKDDYTETMFLGIGINVAAEDNTVFNMEIVDYSLQN